VDARADLLKGSAVGVFGRTEGSVAVRGGGLELQLDCC
jgi:hypothetical protein